MPLHEDRRVGASLSLYGLGLLLMLMLSLIGLNTTAGRTLSSDRPLTLATPSTISVESIHHVQPLP